MPRTKRDVSKSMVALVLSLAALTALGLSSWVPGWLGRDSGMADVEPGMLQVDQQARGIATLGGGVTASLYDSGLRLSHDDDILTETVLRGSFLSAVVGTAEGTGNATTEHVEHEYNHLHITDLRFLPGRAVYSGEVSDGSNSLPVEIRIELAGPVVRIGFSVPLASGVVVHLAHKPATTGLPPVLPFRNLRRNDFWLPADTGRSDPAFTTVLGTDVAIGPAGVARGVDQRSSGRLDLHVWSSSAVVTVSSRPNPSPR
ncbi:hypothetical protein SAMN05216199_2400 [Pedococcus cremeus]|uniref:Uncharacterized protein n=1 Tax=Pedococcus cremeus TaxID=587636 RepID=A0A1H9VLM0_9MICO|nr:hypothetical protein [Pedococcus cremeus]SES22247.1 hypothetical protein SAMN05216199_2400 [Pedococcus cremeus]